MKTITQGEYRNIPDNHKGTYIDYDGKHPE